MHPQPRARVIVTRDPMPITLAVFHGCMLFLTCGLWTPVFLASRRRRKHVTIVPAGLSR